MPLWRFTLLSAVGSLAWNVGLISLGEALAARWTEVAAVLSPASTGLLAAPAVGLAVVAGLVAALIALVVLGAAGLDLLSGEPHGHGALPQHR
jgi:membrane protein DedA with SNARE-associated domain